MSSNATNIERRNDNNKNNKICFNCKRPRHYARNCRAPRTPRTPREVKSKPLTTRSQNTRISKRTRVFKHKETKSKKKVAWSEEDDVSSSSVVKENHEVFSIPGTSVIEDVQYAISLLNEQYKAETWPDQFKPKYDLSLTESPLKQVNSKLHQELNYDPYWAINETSRILSKIRGVAYDDDDLEWYDLGERDNSIEDNEYTIHTYHTHYRCTALRSFSCNEKNTGKFNSLIFDLDKKRLRLLEKLTQKAGC
ncbi:21329_t:CDS:2 [Rhizophagus irregularis]|nr:21329_t:CDS:2 [Rhizophagus irregularis]